MTKVKLNLSADVTSRLPMEPRYDATGVLMNKGLLCARLNSISLADEVHNKGEFAGKTVKVLVFEFQEYIPSPDLPDRFYTHREKIIGTMLKDKTVRPFDAIAKNINELWFRIKHILDTCKAQPTYRDIATLPEDITDEFINLPADGDIDERIADFNKFFEFINSFANGNAEIPAMYKNAAGEGQLMWVKLLPEHPDYDKFALPTWVKGGFLEATSLDTNGVPLPAKIIEVRPNESLQLVVKSKSAPAGAPGANAGAPPMPGAADAGTVDYLRQQYGIKA